MVKTRRSHKIMLVVAFAILIFAMATAQKQPRQLIGAPIVSDKVVDPTEKIRIVTKDENQRLWNDNTERIQALEKRVELLEARRR